MYAKPRMKRAEEIGFALFLVLTFTMFVVLGWGYARRPRIVPLTLSIPGLALAVLHLGNSIAKARRVAKERDSDDWPALVEEPDGAKKGLLSAESRRILEVWFWILALALAINFFGFMVSLPVFLAAFIRFFAKRSWRLSVLIAACFVLAVYLVFYVALKTTL